jgi:hypothetical protein
MWADEYYSLTVENVRSYPSIFPVASLMATGTYFSVSARNL